jgi:galactonate dehydratase
MLPPEQRRHVGGTSSNRAAAPACDALRSRGNEERSAVKITAVKGFPVRAGFRNSWIVKVETDAGIHGLGEGGISGRELAMQGMLEHFERFLVGMDPRRIEHIWQTMYRGAYFEGGRILGAVVSAVDIALWDILGKSLGAPVYQLLGGACRERIQCFETPGSLSGPRCVERAREFYERGWRRQRFTVGMPEAPAEAGPGTGAPPARPGQTLTARADPENVYEPLESIELAVHWIHEVRRALGPGAPLSIDFHHRLSVAEAALFCQQVGDVHLQFLEEPIRAQSPAAYQQLRTMTPIPFAIGEEFSSKWEFAPFVEQGILNFARIDVSNVGGLSESRKVANWCETHYVDVMPHNPLGPVTTAATVHLCAALNNFDSLEYRGELTDAYPRDLFPSFPEVDGDAFPLPTAPGLGVEFDESAAARHAFEFWEAPHLQRRDGAYTNW